MVIPRKHTCRRIGEMVQKGTQNQRTLKMRLSKMLMYGMGSFPDLLSHTTDPTEDPKLKTEASAQLKDAKEQYKACSSNLGS